MKKSVVIFLTSFLIIFIVLNSIIWGRFVYINHKVDSYDINKDGFYDLTEQNDEFDYWFKKSTQGASSHMLLLSKETVFASLMFSFIIVFMYNVIIIIYKTHKKKM